MIHFLRDLANDTLTKICEIFIISIHLLMIGLFFQFAYWE